MRFSSVLGDPFHYIQRAKVRMHHGSKKGYFVALRRAWFMFEPKAYDALVAALRVDSLTEAQTSEEELGRHHACHARRQDLPLVF
jgi:hypothetical protein